MWLPATRRASTGRRRHWEPGQMRGPCSKRRAAAAEAAAATRQTLAVSLFVVLTGALLSDFVVVAALERDPIGLDIFATRQVVRPGIARHFSGRFPYYVVLIVVFHLTNVYRLCDVMFL